MKNLKRILSLALAGTMLVGMMMVGASAASFTDADKVEHKEAANALAALGVMVGAAQPDGTTVFNPEGKLDRAAMAKMIAVIMNKGKDPTFADTDTPSFTDVKAGAWYVPYVEYCANLGYINGYPQADGTKVFAPNGELTATEAARMILNAMGYKWDGQGDWAIATEVQARDEALDLYNGLDEVVTNKPISRDAAAQMLWTAMNKPINNSKVTSVDVYRVDVKASAIAAAGSTPDGTTTKITAADAATLEGLTFSTATDASAVAQSYGLTGGTHFTLKTDSEDKYETLATKYLSVKTDDTQTIAKVEADGKGTYTVTMGNNDKYTKVTENYSNLMGQKVNVMYKATDNVYGITAIGTVEYEGTVGEYLATYTAMPADSGTTTTKGDIGGAAIVEFNKVTGSHGTIAHPSGLSNEWGLKLVKNAKNTYVAIVTPVYVRRVTNVTASTTTLNTGVAGSSVNLTRKDIVEYDGIAKNDYVLVTAKDNAVSKKVEIAKAEINAGVAVDAYNANQQVRIDGKWIPVVNVADFNELKAMKKDATYNVVMVNGYIAAQSPASSGSQTTANTDMIFVVKTVKNAGSGLDPVDTYQARVITKEGKLADITLKGDPTNNTVVGKWCTYEVKNNVYDKLTPVTTTNGTDADDVGYEKAYENINWDATGKALKAGSTPLNLADDAVVVFFHDDDKNTATTTPLAVDNTTTPAAYFVPQMEKLEVLNGKTIKALSANLGSSTAALNVAFTETVGGIEYVKFIFIADKIAQLPGTTGSDKWGWVVSDAYNVSGGLTYDVWTGTETVTVIDTNASSTADKGDVIQYEDLGEGKVKFKSELTSAAAMAVTGYSEADGFITFDGNNSAIKNITDNTAILFIDKTAGTGSATGEIKLADENSFVRGVYTKNVYVKLNGANVELIVVEVNNNVKEGDAVATAAADQSINAATDNATVKGKANGVYALTGSGSLSDETYSANSTDLVLFVFTARNSGTTTAGTQAYTLTVTNKAGAIVYEETSGALTDGTTTSGTAANEKYFFYVDKTGAHLAAGATTPAKPATPPASWVLFDTAANGAAYTYTITGADGQTYGSGNFSL